MKTRTVLQMMMAIAVATACGDKGSASADEPKKETPPPAPAPSEGAEDPATPPETPPPGPATGKEAVTSLMKWLDPDATAIYFTRVPERLDPDTLSVVFGLAPVAQRLLRDLDGIEHALETLGHGELAEALAPTAMVVTPSVSAGNYVVHGSAQPVAKMKETLAVLGMTETTVDGYPVYIPQGSFKWKIALLDDQTVAFVPRAELGSGLGPLTGARDLPPSAMRSQIEAALTEDPSLLATLHAGGPSMHLDLSDDVMLTQFGLRRLGADGLDAQVIIQTSGDPDAARKELSNRSHPEEEQPVQDLMKKVAFEVEKGAVIGRLQLVKSAVETLSGTTAEDAEE